MIISYTIKKIEIPNPAGFGDDVDAVFLSSFFVVVGRIDLKHNCMNGPKS